MPYICKMPISANNFNIETDHLGHERGRSMCNLNVVEVEHLHILQCEKYIDVRRRYLKKYYWLRLSCFKLVQLYYCLYTILKNLTILVNMCY